MTLTRTRIALALCFSVFAAGVGGYMAIDGYPLLDAVYMTVITITTVGYGETRPLSPAGRIFTTVLIILGFGSLGFAGHAFAESLLERIWSGRLEKKKMLKRIAALKGHYIICGFGRVGMAAAEHLTKNSAEVVIIEQDSGQVAAIKEKGYLYLEGDATDDEILATAGVKRASGILPLLASDPLNLFITLSAREMNPTITIIARTGNDANELKLLRAGADEVLSPYKMAGKNIAINILAAHYGLVHPQKESAPVAGRPQWLEVTDGSSMAGKTIGEVSAGMDREILGLRRGERDYIQPDPQMTLRPGDDLLFMDSEHEPVSRPRSAPKKLVIVDDNPVIRRLYSRLFKQAGFIPVITANGEDGVNAILREKPAAAVVDYMLPGISGIEVCRKVRESGESAAVKLILFTADDSDETRRQALASGADEVIIKSPEAKHIVETVVRLLRKKKGLRRTVSP